MTGNRKRGRRGMLAIALAVTAVVAMAVGVSAITASATTVKLLAQANGQGNPQLQAVIDRFMQLNPDIKVEATYLPIGTTYANTLRTQLQSGNGPDVFYVTGGNGGFTSVLPLAKAGYIADLSKQPWVKTFPLAPANRPLYWRRGVLTARARARASEDPGSTPRCVSHGHVEGQALPQPGRRVGAERVALRHGARDEHRACKGPGLEPQAPHRQDDVCGHADVAAHAPAHRRDEERRLFPAGCRGERQHPRHARIRLGAGRELDAADVALDGALQGECFQRLELLFADALAGEREDVGGLAGFLRQVADRLRERDGGCERDGGENAVLHGS